MLLNFGTYKVSVASEAAEYQLWYHAVASIVAEYQLLYKKRQWEQRESCSISSISSSRVVAVLSEASVVS